MNLNFKNCVILLFLGLRKILILINTLFFGLFVWRFFAQHFATSRQIFVRHFKNKSHFQSAAKLPRNTAWTTQIIVVAVSRCKWKKLKVRFASQYTYKSVTPGTFEFIYYNSRENRNKGWWGRGLWLSQKFCEVQSALGGYVCRYRDLWNTIMHSLVHYSFLLFGSIVWFSKNAMIAKKAP